MELKLAFMVLHLLGAIFWIGGIVSVSAVALLGDKGVFGPAHQAVRRVVNPGLAAAWIGGLTMFGLGIDSYLRAGWLHGKITLAVIAAALTGVLSGKLRKAAAGEEVGGVRSLAIAIVVIAICIVVLGKFGNVWMPPRQS